MRRNPGRARRLPAGAGSRWFHRGKVDPAAAFLGVRGLLLGPNALRVRSLDCPEATRGRGARGGGGRTHHGVAFATAGHRDPCKPREARGNPMPTVWSADRACKADAVAHRPVARGKRPGWLSGPQGAFPSGWAAPSSAGTSPACPWFLPRACSVR